MSKCSTWMVITERFFTYNKFPQVVQEMYNSLHVFFSLFYGVGMDNYDGLVCFATAYTHPIYTYIHLGRTQQLQWPLFTNCNKMVLLLHDSFPLYINHALFELIKFHVWQLKLYLKFALNKGGNVNGEI